METLEMLKTILVAPVALYMVVDMTLFVLAPYLRTGEVNGCK